MLRIFPVHRWTDFRGVEWDAEWDKCLSCCQLAFLIITGRDIVLLRQWETAERTERPKTVPGRRKSVPTDTPVEGDEEENESKSKQGSDVPFWWEATLCSRVGLQPVSPEHLRVAAQISDEC